MSADRHVYDDGFFDYISGGARRSADAVAGVVSPLLQGGARVLDVGCGQGVWTARLAQAPGVTEAVGVDGDYVDSTRLAIPREAFVAHDLTKPLDLGRRFDLALSLEVGEHLPPEAGPVLVESLTRHADLVLFSAAVPGQGGEHHVNERPLSWWREEFSRRGYVAVDAVRPKLSGRREVEPWYRNNIILYAAESALGRLPPEMTAARVPEGEPLAEYGSLLWRLRCAALRRLPRAAIERLALTKHAWVRATRPRGA